MENNKRTRTRKTYVVSISHIIGYNAPSIYVDAGTSEMAVEIAKNQSGLSRFPDWNFRHSRTITNEIK